MKRFLIGKVPIDVVSVEAVCDIVKQSVKLRRKGYICVSNMRTVVDANSDNSYLEVMRHSIVNTPDGTPLTWCGKCWGIQETQRVCGPDIFDALLHDSDSALKHYFLGDTEDTLAKLISKLEGECDISGSYSPPFKPLEEYDFESIANNINQSGATIVWTSLRAPKQDFLATKLLPYLNDNVVLIGIGAAFRILLGEYQRPQGLLQRIGLGGLQCLRNTNFGKELCWYVKHTCCLSWYLMQILFRRFVLRRTPNQGLATDSVLILGDGLQALALSRELNEHGYTVDVAAQHREVVRHGRYFRHCIPIADEKHINENQLIKLIKEYHYRVVIPTRDVFSNWLSEHKATLNQMTFCAVEHPDRYNLASDKSLLMDYCMRHDIPCPATMILTQNENDSVVEKISFPALLKPAHSDGARGIKMVSSLDEFQQVAPQWLQTYGDCSLQEYIHDHDYYYNVMLYRYHDGSFAEPCIIKILRYYPISGGSSSLCETVENEPLLKICRRLLDSIQWEGFADFDVLEKGDGDYRIIEINPRVPASLRAANVSGVDFGNIIVSEALGKLRPLNQCRTEVQLRCLGIDIAWFATSPNRWKARPSWFRFFGKNIYYQEGGRHDFCAMCASIFSGVKKQLDPEFRKEKNTF